MTRMNLWKTTIVIWTEYDPQQSELADLCRDAVEGEAYCSKVDSVWLPDPEGDPDWDGTEFFNPEDEENLEIHLEDEEPELPLCVQAMGCYCAGHARGNPVDVECDTSEEG